MALLLLKTILLILFAYYLHGIAFFIQPCNYTKDTLIWLVDGLVMAHSPTFYKLIGALRLLLPYPMVRLDGHAFTTIISILFIHYISTKLALRSGKINYIMKMLMTYCIPTLGLVITQLILVYRPLDTSLPQPKTAFGIFTLLIMSIVVCVGLWVYVDDLEYNTKHINKTALGLYNKLLGLVGNHPGRLICSVVIYILLTAFFLTTLVLMEVLVTTIHLIAGLVRLSDFSQNIRPLLDYTHLSSIDNLWVYIGEREWNATLYTLWKIVGTLLYKNFGINIALLVWSHAIHGSFLITYRLVRVWQYRLKTPKEYDNLI